MNYPVPMRREDLTDVIFAISPKETPFLPRPGIRKLSRLAGQSMRARRRRLARPVRYHPVAPVWLSPLAKSGRKVKYHVWQPKGPIAMLTTDLDENGKVAGVAISKWPK